MNDLVKRLRDYGGQSYDECTDTWLAADEIERLRAREARLREALERYGVHDDSCDALKFGECNCGYVADAADEIERLCAINERLRSDNEQLRAREEMLLKGYDEILDHLSDAVQSDCENGVRALNEIAAKNYLKEYPETRAAFHAIGEIARAALAEQGEKE